MRTQLTTENETEGIYPSLSHATYCCGGVWWFLFCAWPRNPVLSLIFSQQLSSYKPRNWQAFEALTWERETGEIPCSRQKARRTITGWYTISTSHKKVSPKDFLLDCARGDLNCAPAPASPEIMVTAVNYYNWCVCQNVLGGIWPQKTSRELTCKIWSMKTHNQYQLHLHVTQSLVAYVCLVCSCIQCGAMQTKPEDTRKTPYKGFNRDKKSRSFTNLYLQVMENVFAIYSNNLQSVFQQISVCGGEHHYFCSANIVLSRKGSYWGWVCHWAWGWMRAEQSSFDFMQAACSTTSKEHFGFQGMQPCLIKVLMLGFLMELAWPYCVYHWGQVGQ